MKANEIIYESPRPGHTIDIEFGDLLIETEIVDVTEDGLVVHLDETAMELILDAKRQYVAEGSNNQIVIDGKQVDYSSIEVDDVDRRDYPDFSDAYISRAEFVDGTPLNDEQLEQLNNDYGDLVNELAHDSLRENVEENSQQRSLNPAILGQMIAKENPSLRDEGEILQAAEHWVRSSRKDLYKDPKRIYITLIEPIADDIVRAFKGSLRLSEAKYQGRTVQLGKRMKGDVKKFKVYVKNKKGNVIKVNFGQKGVKIKKNNPARRKSFRARHNCATAKDRTTPRYWSCRAW